MVLPGFSNSTSARTAAGHAIRASAAPAAREHRVMSRTARARLFLFTIRRRETDAGLRGDQKRGFGRAVLASGAAGWCPMLLHHSDQLAGLARAIVFVLCLGRSVIVPPNIIEGTGPYVVEVEATDAFDAKAPYRQFPSGTYAQTASAVFGP
jgi:hypothetical protein